jgi:predicted DNA-binding helix-hairpin-helix protein
MILEKLQKLGLGARYDSCGGGKEKSFREYGIPYEYQSFIYNCTQSSENVFVNKMLDKGRMQKHSRKLYEKNIPTLEEKKEAWNLISRTLPTSKKASLNKTNKCLLVKVLQDNSCVHDCKYCSNTSCKEKVSLEPNELITAYEKLWNQGYTTGLFLSSAVHKSPENSTEKMIASARILRERGYKGYIHLKVLPETPEYLIREMALYANRLSINIEATTQTGFSELTSTKSYKHGVLKKISTLDKLKREADKQSASNSGWFCDSREITNGEDFRFKSFTTQIILGANNETDSDVIQRMNSLYEETSLYRTYFSAFSPIEGTALENTLPESKIREHRLYEADWLFRVYNFDKKTIEKGLNEKGNFFLGCDVKQSIARAIPDLFPLDPNTATKKELLLVPGIGVKSAEKIIQMRQNRPIKEFTELEEEGIRVGKAKAFILAEGAQKSLFSF